MVWLLLVLSTGALTLRTVAAPVQILPLGDSITQGPGNVNCSEPSYRYFLATNLAAHGIDFEFLGTKTSAFGGFGSWDQRHQGMPGWRAEQLLAGGPDTPGTLNSWLQIYTHDYVLLHIGTNDRLATNPEPASETISQIRQVISALRSDNPMVAILLCKIIPLEGHSGIADFNALIPSLVVELHTPASPVHLVDMTPDWIANAADPDTDTCDWVHPNKQGAQKMADRFSAVLLPLLEDGGGGSTTSGHESTGGTSAGEGSDSSGGSSSGSISASGSSGSTSGGSTAAGSSTASGTSIGSTGSSAGGSSGSSTGSPSGVVTGGSSSTTGSSSGAANGTVSGGASTGSPAGGMSSGGGSSAATGGSSGSGGSSNGSDPNPLLLDWIVQLRRPKPGKSIRFRSDRGLRIAGTISSARLMRRTVVTVDAGLELGSTVAPFQRFSSQPVRNGIARFRARRIGLGSAPELGGAMEVRVRATLDDFSTSSTATNRFPFLVRP